MRILIADDHRIMREGVRMLLSDHPDIEVVGEAETAESVLEMLAVEKVDVVLMDLEMPGIGGLDAIGTIRSRFPEVGIAILSMHDRSDYVRQAIQSGAGAYLLKNASRGEVIQALVAVAAGRSYIQPELVMPLVTGATEAPFEAMELTQRELEVLGLMALGRDTAHIAEDLGIAETTVRTHVKSLFARLGVHSRAEAVAVGLRAGLIH